MVSFLDFEHEAPTYRRVFAAVLAEAVWAGMRARVPKDEIHSIISERVNSAAPECNLYTASSMGSCARLQGADFR